MAGEFAIYTRKSIFNKWIERDTFADIKAAEHIAEKINNITKYY